MMHLNPITRIDRSNGYDLMRSSVVSTGHPLGRGLLRAFHFMQWPPESLEQWSLCGTVDSNVGSGNAVRNPNGETYYDFFTTANRYVNVSNASGLSGTAQFTILCRGYTDAITWIIAGVNSAASEFVGMNVGVTTGIGNFYVTGTLYGQISISDGWANYGMVYNGSPTGNANKLKVYVNGEKVTATYPGGTIPASSGAVTRFDVNRWTVAGAYAYASGWIAQVLVYNLALSDDEVRMWHQNRFGMYAQNNTLRLGVMPWAGGVAAAMFRNRKASRAGFSGHYHGVQ
jgi:hypothetical protein